MKSRGQEPQVGPGITDHSQVAAWLQDIRESGIWLAFAIVLILGIPIGILDVSHWDHEFSNSILAEANAVVLELFLAGVVIAVYDYRRRRNQEVRNSQKELVSLRLSGTSDAVVQKTILVNLLAARGHKPTHLDYYVFDGARLNGFDFSASSLRFIALKGSTLVRTSFARADLFSADLTNSCLVEANFAETNLREAVLTGARISGANLEGADLENADLRGVRELTCDQLMTANNWQLAYRDESLACGKTIPSYEERSIGQQARELLRRVGNPTYPYVLASVMHSDDREETIVIEESH